MVRLQTYAHEIALYAHGARGPADVLRFAYARFLRPRLADIHSDRFGTVTVRPRTTDLSVVGEVLSGCYDPAVHAAGAGIIVDLGAHIGLVSRMFQRRLSQPIVAVEGNPQNVPLLRRNLPDVVVIDRPVAATRRKVKMTTGRLDGCRILDDDNGVETITMDDIDGSIGLLKIDVEGIEEELLADCPRWIHRVAAIVCECHYPYTGDDMLAALRDGGANPQIVARLDAPIFNYDLVTVRLGDPDEV